MVKLKEILGLCIQSLINKVKADFLYGSEWSVYRLTSVIGVVYSNVVTLFGWYYLGEIHINASNLALVFSIPLAVIFGVLLLTKYALLNKKVNVLPWVQTLINASFLYAGFIGCLMFLCNQFGMTSEQSIGFMAVIPLTNVACRFMTSWRSVAY